MPEPGENSTYFQSSTSPEGSTAAEAFARAVCIDPVDVHPPVAGLYSSAEANGF